MPRGDPVHYLLTSYLCLQTPVALRAVYIASDHPYSHAHASQMLLVIISMH